MKLFDFRGNLNQARVDEEMKTHMDSVLALPTDGVIGYQISTKVFAIKDTVSTLSPLGWVHIYKTDLGKLHCSLR